MKRTKLGLSTFCFHSNNKWGVKIVVNIKKNSVVENLCKIEMKKEQFFLTMIRRIRVLQTWGKKCG